MPWQFLKVCRPFNERPEWRLHIGGKLGRNKVNATATNLLQAIVSSTSLRRTKEMRDADGRPIIELPEISHHTYKIKLDPKAREIYDLAQHDIQERVRTMILDNEVRKNFTNILTFLLRLRQLACATPLCPQSFIDTIEGAKNLQEEEVEIGGTAVSKERKLELQRVLFENRTSECPLCYDTLTEPRITPCSHIYDYHCLQEWLQRKSCFHHEDMSSCTS
jgi:SWI/SNF-related matrix-associated actin-dependent regulator of chromatin subfamily A3